MSCRICAGRSNLVQRAHCQTRVRRTRCVIRSQIDFERNLFGENFGARDPFVGEVATGFGEKPLGNMNTEHIIKPPDKMKEHLGLLSRQCQNVELTKLDEKDITRMRNQVPGWKLLEIDGVQVIEQEFKCRDFKSAVQLVYRFGSIMEFESHFPRSVAINDDFSLIYQLSSKEVKGLSERDFIVAAKINGMVIDDLLPPKKKRLWA
eukprot:TRINITY_DN28237_c1_g2_i1.p2 TRINITY_DN28237_c1_g2~~TRINITY_DN28237_c1_g2_i1.p2  ORF type:complete len:206 (-),score=23.32 TRINITY_DN28237_c1_g2_i1:256-873(-)